MVVGNHNVFRLQIPVHNVVLMQVFQPLHKLPEVPLGYFLVEFPSVNDVLVQFSALDKLSRYVDLLVAFNKFVQSYDVPVVHFLEDGQLLDDIPLVLGVHDAGLLQNLDGYLLRRW